MSDNNLAKRLEILKELNNKVLAGRAAIDESEIKNLCADFELELNESLNTRFLNDSAEYIVLWESLLLNLSISEFAKDAAGFINTDLYFNFGRLILDKLNNGDEQKINKIAHHYLDLFRHSEFLVKIYDEKKWTTLISEIIKKSNFNFSELFDQRCRKYKNKNIFTVLRGDSEQNFTFDQIQKPANGFANNLMSLLIDENKEKGKIAFLTDNSLNMVLLDLACLTSGIVNIMIPANSVPQHISFILNETEAPVILASDEKQLSKIKAIKAELNHLKKVVLIEGNSAEDWVISLSELQKLKNEKADEVLNSLKNTISTDSLASIMYTSGTTGTPKGIMFSQMNIVYKRFCRAMALPNIGDKDKYLAYLPLFHTFGRYLEMTGAIFWGAEYVFMENPSVETMLANMKKVSPTIFISIPKKWLQLHEHITQIVDIEFSDEAEIKNAVEEATGGKLKWGLSAAGFLPPEVFQFFQKYGIELMSGFGMTEATGGITMTPPNQYFPNSLGKALPGIEIKVAEDGELLIKGEYVMIGYYHEEPDSPSIIDGWFATGDIMRMDENKFIEIIDRKKEIYKNIKGETIAPQKIENYFRDFEFVKQVFLVGDHRSYNTVLIKPNYEAVNNRLSTFDDVQKQEYFSSVIVTVNNFLAPFERILDFKLIDREFSLEKGELTPKGTYKRRVVEDNFSDIIESMYKKSYISIYLGKTEIRIPNWFLREKGCLSSDIVADSDGIAIPKLKLLLNIKIIDKDECLYKIGSYIYQIKSRFIDFQPLLINPLFWLGNKKFTGFTGSSIIQWFRQHAIDEQIQFYSAEQIDETDADLEERVIALLAAGEQSLSGLHEAVKLIQYSNSAANLEAIKYFELILKDDTLPAYKFVTAVLHRPTLTDKIELRREMLRAAVKKFENNKLENLLNIYLSSEPNVLDEELNNFIVSSSKGFNNLFAIENVLSQTILRNIETKDYDNPAIPSLMHLLKTYGTQHPTTYDRVRQTFVRCRKEVDLPLLNLLAEKSQKEMKDGFREWLGVNETVAVDMETEEEYNWSDVIILEEGIDEDDSKRIVDAITKTPVVREAVFLFYGGKIIRLSNLLPGGVWISHLRSYHDKSVYRISLQTRHMGSFDIVVNLNKKRSTEDILEEVNWLILSGSRFFLKELVEDFGGYWDEYDLWSGKFVPGETVSRFLLRESRKKDESSTKRLYFLWPFFVWNASAAYVNFWKLTGHQMILSEPTIDNFIIPSHDYQTGTKVVSFSERRDYKSLEDLFMNFYESYIEPAEEQYPFLKRSTIWNYIFSGLINAEGEKEGIKMLKTLSSARDPKFSEEFYERITKFINTVEEDGFIPKQLYFAIKRFHRWFRLNSDASLTAQAEMISDLYETYHLPRLQQNNPETRTKFFLNTIFAESDEDVKLLLKDIVDRHREKSLDKGKELELLSNIKTEIELNEREDFFITRLSYPHLKASDSAVLEKIKSEGMQTTNLVVQYLDQDGIPFLIRKPISPKEISNLHQLFIETNLLVNFNQEHEFLIALSERGFIIGGMFYSQIDENTVHMEKIVVSNRYRRKGISDKLMNELFNRLKSAKIKFVTTGFFRPEYFYRFGFKIEKKYSGLVKNLED
ncbi:MAG: GNAT family N-acetyltransferase [Ignavibacteriae bacterium]|nr:GNAT family N-acetyltransferase [Ignavibacteriota bacterium]NOG97419.1 GNAT family N-acetyltransferase [Ignavibacteriota bacterium]